MVEVKYIENGPLRYKPLWWHLQGLQETRSGYGAKLTTPYVTSVEGREYRVYATQYSNAATYWIRRYGVKYHLRNEEVEER